MSIPKVVGIEEEYAIQLQGDHGLTAFQASCLLVNAYARKAGLRVPGTRLLWDYGHETPFSDFRGRLFGKNTGQEAISDDENLRINAILPNGARLYTDHAHPEYSTPECLSARSAVACDKAGEMILREALIATRESIPELKIGLFKNNVDYWGHSYGCHENYLMEAEAHEECLVRNPDKVLRSLVPFLVTRQLFAGAGKVGSATGENPRQHYALSQRAHFIEQVFGLETTYSRPIINTREEHHADSKRFRRLHLILGDANMSEFACFLKIGATQIVLQMLEDHFLNEDLTLRDPVKAMRRVAEFNFVVELDDGRTIGALDIQRILLAKAEQYCRSGIGVEVPDAGLILESWEYALSGLENLTLSKDFELIDDPMRLAGRLDWVAKLWLIQRFRSSRNRTWDSPELRVIDLQYHNIEPEEGLFAHLESQGLINRILEDTEILRAVKHAPPDTRAYFRGKCIEKFPDEILLVNWEVVGFDHGEVHRMVPLLNPLKGTRDQFEKVFDRCSNSRELLEMVQA
ncbi:MAG: proteasome accessory factor PafA2 family protein [Desulfomonile tiedjei]|uniref:Proteasome accessory factor PafA2 family protein n=1 Tax=Desulfomonile tiedjei TaxID=2358 RepID=A0A9D6Z4G6_9BACT|nr:proteasome accessory factor PafA2 family protein [Desulfomonile tiedjei]